MKKIEIGSDYRQGDDNFGLHGLDTSMYDKGKKNKKKHKKKKAQQKEARLAAFSQAQNQELGALSFADQPIGWYNQQETKGNLGNSLLKGLVEILVAGVGAPYLGAALGKYAPYLGSAIIIGGHYFGDKTGVFKTLGAAVVAYGVAKSKENNSENPEPMLLRIMQVKDEIFRAFLLKKYKEETVDGFEDSNGDVQITVKGVNESDLDGAVLATDEDESGLNGELEALDQFDQDLARQAALFAQEHPEVSGSLEDYEKSFSDESFEGFDTSPDDYGFDPNDEESNSVDPEDHT